MEDRSGSSSSSLFTSGSDSSSTYPPSDLPEFIREDDVLPATPYINADPRSRQGIVPDPRRCHGSIEQFERGNNPFNLSTRGRGHPHHTTPETISTSTQAGAGFVDSGAGPSNQALTPVNVPSATMTSSQPGPSTGRGVSARRPAVRTLVFDNLNVNPDIFPEICPAPFGHEPACRPVALRGLSEDGKKPAIRNMIDFTQILPVKPPFTAPEPEFVEDVTDQQQYTGAERQRYLKLHAKNLKRLEYEKTARVSLPMEALRLYFNPRKYIMMAPRKSDELKWQGVLEGQPDTPYEGGYFWFQVQFSGLYLREAPQITFLTRVWHPYVSAKGSLLLPKEQLDKYPATAIDGLLDWMVELLLTIPPDPPGPYSSITTQFPAEREDPNDDDPEAIARDRARMAREWTKKYALGGG